MEVNMTVIRSAMEPAQKRWVLNLIEQYPLFESVIVSAAEEATGLSSPDFGDCVLGHLEEAGAEV
jgi:hypothetical protein